MAGPGGSLSAASPQAAPPDEGSVLDALPVATLVVDAAGRVARANAACEALLNLSERAICGAALDTVLTLPGRPAEGSGQGGLAVFDAELRVARGAVLRVDYASAPIAHHDGWRVITLHHAPTAQGLGHSPDRRSGAQAAVGAAAMLAHEVRNPLSGIRGAAQLLQRELPDSTELATLITVEVDRIATLIDTMQDFGDTRPLPTSEQSIYPIIAHARRLADTGFASEVAIEEAFDPSLPPAALNRDALVQILINLLKNASEAVAHEREPRIVISTAYRHGVALSPHPGQPRRALPIEICVTDNGPGAPAAIADHLFDPFVSGRPEGKGLGLALVDKLMRDMGGLVQYVREGQPPVTSFRLRLPRWEAAA